MDFGISDAGIVTTLGEDLEEYGNISDVLRCAPGQFPGLDDFDIFWYNRLPEIPVTDPINIPSIPEPGNVSGTILLSFEFWRHPYPNTLVNTTRTL